MRPEELLLRADDEVIQEVDVAQAVGLINMLDLLSARPARLRESNTSSRAGRALLRDTSTRPALPDLLPAADSNGSRAAPSKAALCVDPRAVMRGTATGPSAVEWSGSHFSAPRSSSQPTGSPTRTKLARPLTTEPAAVAETLTVPAGRRSATLQSSRR
jgi:hypothetical protein